MTLLSTNGMAPILARLREANDAFHGHYPGECSTRQPVHTVYGGAHLFRADTMKKLQTLALDALDTYGGNFAIFGRALEFPGHEDWPESDAGADTLAERITADPAGFAREDRKTFNAYEIHRRVRKKLETEPVEDYRLDFEDGYGNRPDDEEDECARNAAELMAAGMEQDSLPAGIGIRIKSLGRETHERALRTLDIFIETLTAKTGGKLPRNFVVTLPKVVVPAHVTALVDAFELIEAATPLESGALRLELMVETTQSLIDAEGRCTLPRLVAAARGRCVAAHFGVYDYTASCSIAAKHQWMHHPACDHARHLMQVALAGTGVWLSDGATNILPIPAHRPEGDASLTHEQLMDNRSRMHDAWRMHYDHVQHSLEHAYYQGWDLHPAQLPTRYAALYEFFLGGLYAATMRLRNFMEVAARATVVGETFDDAATGQGLLNFFLRGMSCGAITEREASHTGLTPEELATRSFLKILEGRQERG